eukprot:39216-Prorocentrum_minimum.AAC.1
MNTASSTATGSTCRAIRRTVNRTIGGPHRLRTSPHFGASCRRKRRSERFRPPRCSPPQVPAAPSWSLASGSQKGGVGGQSRADRRGGR